jgi:predicted ABC-type ATPase
MDWFNPDDWSRALQTVGHARQSADVAAWNEGQRRLRWALANCQNYAFETTLGGRSVTRLLLDACTTHDVLIWYVGLDSVDLHIERVGLRVANGGHSIPEVKIRQRYVSSMANLTRLVRHVYAVQVYDNSDSVAAGEALRPPLQVASIVEGRLRMPKPSDLHQVPTWAKPVVESVLGRTE